VGGGSSISGKGAILNALFAAMPDGKITKAELQGILIKVGLGVVNKGLPGQLRRVYDLTDPDLVRQSAERNIELALAEVGKAHYLIGELLKEVE